jgi:poly [ADP-ribose] polymerase
MKIAEDIMKNAKKTDIDTTMHQLDRQFKGLGMNEMTPLSPQSTEYQELENYLQKTKGNTHYLNYKVEDIFRIERNGEFDRFEESEFGKMAADRRLLWHGSRTTNFGGILSQGLRIAPPEAPSTGYMFGKGVYLADMSSKSANYCNHHTSGNVGLLL